MSYSPFFLSGFQHAAQSSSLQDNARPRRGSMPENVPSRSARKPVLIRQRSLSTLDLPLSSNPPSSSLPAVPETPSSPTSSSTLLPKDSKNMSRPVSTSSSLSSYSPLPPYDDVRRRSFSLTSLLRSNSTVTSSTVSTRHRRTKRSDALARLEGRSSQWYTKARDSWYHAQKKKSLNDFMSMSDESDLDEENDESFTDIALDFGLDFEDSESSKSSFRLASPPGKRLSKLLPFSTSLHSFMDLENDRTKRDSSLHPHTWNGRSFIDIPSL